MTAKERMDGWMETAYASETASVCVGGHMGMGQETLKALVQYTFQVKLKEKYVMQHLYKGVNLY